ncbi:MAG: glycosyltransferase family 39 protein, partial [Pseudomonadota bacterium]
GDRMSEGQAKASGAAARGDAPFSRSLGAIVVWASKSAWRRGLMVALLALVLLAPGITSLGPIDRDETRFAQASKQMLESGDFVDIRLQDDPRHKKPVGIYWAQSAAAAIVGDGAAAEIWAYRLPSLVGAILAALLTTWATRPLIGARASFLAGAMLAGLTVLSFEARVAKTDAALLAAIIAAQGALARLWFGVKDGPRERGLNIFIFWTAIGLGFLIKGPIVLLPAAGVILWMSLYDRSLAGIGRLGLGWGIVWFLLIVGPWFAAIIVKTEGAFLAASLGEDLLGKVGQGKEAHGAPPGAYLIAFWGTFWPWTLIALMAAPRVWRWRRAPETAFLLGWIVPTWIVFELVATKLPHYVMPTYPAILALAAAAAIDGAARPVGWLYRVGVALWAGPALALPIGFAVLPNVDLAALPGTLRLAEGGLVWEPIALGAVAILCFAAALRWLRSGVWIGFIRATLFGCAALYVSGYVFAFPATQAIWTSERMAAVTNALDACVAERTGARPRIGSVRYHEASLVFLTRTDFELLEPAAAAAALIAEPNAMIWVERRRDAPFQAALAEGGGAAAALARTTGFNYARGKWVDLTLYASAAASAPAACAATTTTTGERDG